MANKAQALKDLRNLADMLRGVLALGEDDFTQLADIEKTIVDLAKQRDSLATQVEEAENRLALIRADAQSTRDALMAEQAATAKRCSEMKADLQASIAERKGAAEAEVAQLRKSRADLQAQLQSDMDARAATLGALDKQIQESQGQLAAIKRQVAELRDSITASIG